MRLASIFTATILSLSSLALADQPAPPPAGPAEKVNVTPTVTSAKPGLTERETITVRGTLPNEISNGTFELSTSAKFNPDTKVAQITLGVTAPKGATFKKNSFAFTQKVSIAELKPFKGKFSIVVVSPEGTELHRFDQATK